MERGRIQGLPKFFGYPLLSQKRVKLRTLNFVGTFIGSIGTKAHENVGNSGHGRSQGVPKIFKAPICTAHCAVIFATAQLSCWLLNLICKNFKIWNIQIQGGFKDFQWPGIFFKLHGLSSLQGLLKDPMNPVFHFCEWNNTGENGGCNCMYIS